MTYHCGIGRGLAAFGLYEREPHVSCNSCGATTPAQKKNGDAYQWFIQREAPRGWSLEVTEASNGELFRVDLCGKCRKR